jgi:hypothetical protein
MKNKFNRILPILALVVLSGTPLFTKSEVAANAALTKPTSYDYSYEYQSSTSRFEYTTYTGQSRSSFTRTADGSFFNYIQNTRSLWVHPDYDGIDNNQFLSVDTIFNRSNTTWNAYTSFVGAPIRYEPTSTNVGSSTGNGNIDNKVILTMNNQTNKDYLWSIDVSSTGNFSARWSLFLNNDSQTQANSIPLFNYPSNAELYRIYLPAFTKLTFRTTPGTSINVNTYLDAWYLKDLGVSASYNEGYDDGELIGYQDGYNNSASPLWDGLEVVVGVSVNFILFIMTLSIFDISLLNVGIVLISILGIVWVLKAFRG